MGSEANMRVFIQNHWVKNLVLRDESAVHETVLSQVLDANGLMKMASLNETQAL